MYMRNRYYDPATGQFTQTDPIGIAGGLNTYGFAAGDPVSYSDPYGLSATGGGCPCWPVVAEQVVRVIFRAARAQAEFKRNMAAIGELPQGRFDEAHHIVAFADPRAAPAREVLERFDIGQNAGENGVYLPGPRANGHSDERYAHRSVHTNAYFNEINDRLAGAETREQAIEELRDIAADLKTKSLESLNNR
jgi:uncharacterized protein RhaS with RHS repeats